MTKGPGVSIFAELDSGFTRDRELRQLEERQSPDRLVSELPLADAPVTQFVEDVMRLCETRRIWNYSFTVDASVM